MYFSIVCYITIHGIMRKKNRENMFVCVGGVGG